MNFNDGMEKKVRKLLDHTSMTNTEIAGKGLERLYGSTYRSNLNEGPPARPTWVLLRSST